ncbi:hypothetical protein VST7929_01026 [Vibrio stylophorae]|uniref:CidA/LrgA family protein n=1 Tax=Vibrio stylophorae TaxID=659351 RepID=A0ABM8ZSQ0_9VIBR|nr:CidA/LrgA family protein [Vibrio stylophorae]CAH0533164.1 hypothetical protein VST7929_01026 [Vibrio stylophorae]
MQYLKSFFTIMVCLYIGKGIQHFTGIAVPGSVIGMLILFLLLALQWVPPCWAKASSELLIKHMAVLFVPVAVGVMNYYDLLTQNAWAIILSTLGSSFVILLVVGFLTQKLKGKQS